MRIEPFIAFTVLHLTANVIAGGLGFIAIMAAFDGEGPMIAARAAYYTLQFLSFPIAALSAIVDVRGLGAAAGVALFLANSLIWGALASTVWSWFGRRRERTPGVSRRAPIIGHRGAV